MPFSSVGSSPDLTLSGSQAGTPVGLVDIVYDLDDAEGKLKELKIMCHFFLHDFILYLISCM